MISTRDLRRAGRLGARALTQHRAASNVRRSPAPPVGALTEEWLTSALCAGVPDARVVELRSAPPPAGPRGDHTVRVRYNTVGQAAGLPTSLLVLSRDMVRAWSAGCAEDEAAFHALVRPTLSIRGPRAYYAGFDPRTSRSTLLLEDVRRAGWSFPDPMHHQVSRRDAEDMVRELALYHGSCWEHSRFADDWAFADATEWQEGVNGTTRFERHTRIGLGRARRVLPRDLVFRRSELQTALMRSLALYRAEPQTLVHQDLHVGSWVRDAQGRLTLWEWTCVARGHWALDFSHALGSVLAVEDRRYWERDLIELYLGELHDAGVRAVPTPDEAWLAYRRQMVHALVFALAKLGRRPWWRRPDDDDLLWAARRVAQAAADLDSFAAILS